MDLNESDLESIEQTRKDVKISIKESIREVEIELNEFIQFHGQDFEATRLVLNFQMDCFPDTSP